MAIVLGANPNPHTYKECKQILNELRLWNEGV